MAVDFLRLLPRRSFLGLMIRNPGESAMRIDADREREITLYIPCGSKAVNVSAFSWRDGELVRRDVLTGSNHTHD